MTLSPWLIQRRIYFLKPVLKILTKGCNHVTTQSVALHGQPWKHISYYHKNLSSHSITGTPVLNSITPNPGRPRRYLTHCWLTARSRPRWAPSWAGGSSWAAPSSSSSSSGGGRSGGRGHSPRPSPPAPPLSSRSGRTCRGGGRRSSGRNCRSERIGRRSIRGICGNWDNLLRLKSVAKPALDFQNCKWSIEPSNKVFT